jgi:hypothetical protein
VSLPVIISDESQSGDLDEFPSISKVANVHVRDFFNSTDPLQRAAPEELGDIAKKSLKKLQRET